MHHFTACHNLCRRVSFDGGADCCSSVIDGTTAMRTAFSFQPGIHCNSTLGADLTPQRRQELNRKCTAYVRTGRTGCCRNEHGSAVCRRGGSERSARRRMLRTLSGRASSARSASRRSSKTATCSSGDSVLATCRPLPPSQPKRCAAVDLQTAALGGVIPLVPLSSLLVLDVLSQKPRSRWECLC